MTSSGASSNGCGSDHCITCADAGVPMTVVRIDGARGLAVCADGSVSEADVETALVEHVAVGDALLVHAGVAIAALEPGEAVA